jgi:hypothetical protein
MDQSQTSTSTEPLPSPLTETNSDTITELFSRDPMEWTGKELDAAILYWRQVRSTLGVDQKPAKASKAELGLG